MTQLASGPGQQAMEGVYHMVSAAITRLIRCHLDGLVKVELASGACEAAPFETEEAFGPRFFPSLAFCAPSNLVNACKPLQTPNLLGPSLTTRGDVLLPAQYALAVS